MRVKYINAVYDEDLTVGKIYDVISENDFNYIIIDDANDEYSYRKEYFEVIEEDLKNISTCDLVEELIKREGVISHEIGNEEMFRITTVDFEGNVKHKKGYTSSCILLEIFD